MKPWPKELAERYPLSRKQAQYTPWDRPWWGEASKERSLLALQDRPWRSVASYRSIFDKDWVRSDGLYFSCSTEDAAALREAADAQDPLPHPGFRVGQVWAFPMHDKYAELAQTGFDIVAVASDTVWSDNTRFLRFSDEIAWSTGPMDLFSERDIPELLCMESYLLADPCCPWLAPWSSS